VRLNLPVISETVEWKIDQLAQLKTQIQGDPRKPNALSTADQNVILHFLTADVANPSIAERISLAFIFLFKAILRDFNKGHGLDVILDSHLPIAAGLGSSASVAVCLSAAMLKIAKIISTNEGTGNDFAPEELELINQWAYIVEKIFHGNPSGVDNCTCTYGGIVSYTNGSFNKKQVNLPLRILVVNTMVPRMTKEIVAGVRRKMEKYPAIVNPILEAMDQIANCFENSLLQVSLPEDHDKLFGIFEELIDINQGLLTALGVSHPKLQDIVSTVSEYGLHGKLTGAGGGGVAFVLVRPDIPVDVLESAKATLKERGSQCWDVTIGGGGVKLERKAL